jgi:predicted metal-dependent peptidase
MTTTNKKALDQLIAARIHLLLDHYFFGRLAMNLKLEEDKTIPTLAVDGKHIVYNPDFILTLTPKLTQSAFVHEIMHCVLEHMLRCNGRDPRRFNAAADYAVNLVLKDSGFQIGPSWLIDEKYRDMSAEHIYDLLKPEDVEDLELFDDVQDGATSAGEAIEAALDWEVNVQAAIQAAKMYGKLPKGMKRFIEELEQPQVPWQSVLQRFVSQTSRNDYSWSKPSKRMTGHGFCMPSLHSESMGVLAAGIDTSGSIDGPTLSAFGAEITAAFNSGHPERMYNIYCDSEVAHVDEIDGNGELPPFVGHGGGGTDLREIFNWLAEHDIKPAALIVLTDGYTPFPATEPDFPVLWCMTTTVEAPFGETVRIRI